MLERATITNVAARCGGFIIAARFDVMPIADAPYIPTLPFDQDCFATHSTVS